MEEDAIVYTRSWACGMDTGRRKGELSSNPLRTPRYREG